MNKCYELWCWTCCCINNKRQIQVITYHQSYIYVLCDSILGMLHLMHLFTMTWMPVSAPWNVKILATCVTLIGLVRRYLHIWQDISPGINLDRMMNNHARDNKLTVTGNNTWSYMWKITEPYLLFIVFFAQVPIFTRARQTIGWLWRHSLVEIFFSLLFFN